MFEIVLYQPEIPPNTGAIMRLCANAGCRLHLVRPLGFSVSDRALARAGMDYRERLAVSLHDDWTACAAALGDRRRWLASTRGGTRYDHARFAAGDAIVFGPESRGLPAELLQAAGAANCLRIPMSGAGRSLNLATAVAVVVYEGWRQGGFAGAAGT